VLAANDSEVQKQRFTIIMIFSLLKAKLERERPRAATVAVGH
jgi:hypothetical protein